MADVQKQSDPFTSDDVIPDPPGKQGNLGTDLDDTFDVIYEPPVEQGDSGASDEPGRG
jgi:hypothetical protein